MPAHFSPDDRAQPRLSMRIGLVELETFIAVAELGSFSQAAQRLHVTQPSVTTRVKRLEDALGTKLFVRTTRRVETTPDGTRLLREASAALASLRTLVDEFTQEGRLARQRVVVAATPIIASDVLPPLVRSFSERFTDIRLTLLDLVHREVLAAVESGEADVGVLALDGEDQRFRAEPLMTEDVLLVVPRQHPLASRREVTLEQIADCKLMIIEQFQPMRQRIAEELQRRGVQMPPATVVAHVHTLLGMLNAGMGVALMPRYMATRCQVEGHAACEIDGIRLTRTYSLVHLRKATPSSATVSFASFLRKALEGGLESATRLYSPGSR